MQSVQEAENLLESTRKAQSNVWLFLKYREASLRTMDRPTEKGVCGTGRMKDELVVNLLSPVSWHFFVVLGLLNVSEGLKKLRR